jgi:hypothetical protein
VQAFLHPAIKSELLTFEPPMALLDLIDAYLIGPNEKIIVMTAAEIQRELTSETSECRFEARRLLPRPTTCGRYLSSLAGMCSRVVDVRTSERRAYRITCRPDDGEFEIFRLSFNSIGARLERNIVHWMLNCSHTNYLFAFTGIPFRVVSIWVLKDLAARNMFSIPRRQGFN